MSTLIMFHGLECPHCKRMMPIVDKLEKEDGIAFEKLEVWHNDQNADKMRSMRDIIEPKCGGQLRTPTFLNSETNDVLCGEIEYETLKEWASKSQ
ncbi:thioredoxin family protein [Acidobacteriota bacterium]